MTMNQRPDRVTIVDVARAAGTSVSSASVALRGESGVSERTRIRILRTADQLGYQPDQRARVLREQRSRLLGVTFAVDQTFDAELVEHLYAAVADTGYDLVLSATTGARSEVDAVESLLRDRCPTLVLISPQLSTEQLVELSRRASVVTIGSDLRAEGVDSVHSDDRRGITAAVDHLVGLGHRAISYVDGGRAVLSSTRRDGYLDAMAAHGLGVHAHLLTGQPTEESGIEAARQLLLQKRLPTAVLAHNDMIAFGLLLTLRANGVAVPGEVSVVGYDDTRLAGLSTVGLTSVSQDARLLARTAIARAVARTEVPDTPAPEFVAAPALIVRATSGPPRAR
jgi:DNA-binding LacI/PurR family transcriptional regulator